MDIRRMIGGYLYRTIDRDLAARLERKLVCCEKLKLWDVGHFFFSSPHRSNGKSCVIAPDLAALSEDLPVSGDGGAEYRLLDLETDFLELFRKHEAPAFDHIQSDCRMAVLSKKEDSYTLFLASHRAGAGRIYYHRLDSGIVFCSDLRFLLSIIPLDVNPLGIYSVLKYGSIPEPLTISRNISAVPPAHYVEYGLKRGGLRTVPYFRFRFPCDSGGAVSSLHEVESALKRSASFLAGYPSAMLLSGGIDSSLYGCYLNEVCREPVEVFYCAFGSTDPEFPYASAIARKLGLELNVAVMRKADALKALDDVVRFAAHPFSDFSSLPIVFLLKYISERLDQRGFLIECNGADDCFGFGDLQNQTKFRFKRWCPKNLKRLTAVQLRNSTCWKWESSEGLIARVAALADVHEQNMLNYFLVQAPVNYLSIDRPPEWDETLEDLIEQTSSNCGEDYRNLGYEAKTTIRQLLYVNSGRWAAKALSVGENLGIRVLYPYIWRDVLEEQGRLPWSMKVNGGIVKWPLKKLLENFMPPDFIYRKKSGFVPPFAAWLTNPEFNEKVRGIIASGNAYVTQILPLPVLDELLSDALSGRRLRFPVLNMLWGAIFAESWIRSVLQNVQLAREDDCKIF
ncbi:MAG: hypothetical protein GXX84_06460 [Acidobacteria bacterium]|nr:hypothetical protein [Acidobacteriota bacterium]